MYWLCVYFWYAAVYLECVKCLIFPLPNNSMMLKKEVLKMTVEVVLKLGPPKWRIVSAPENYSTHLEMQGTEFNFCCIYNLKVLVSEFVKCTESPGSKYVRLCSLFLPHNLATRNSTGWPLFSLHSSKIRYLGYSIAKEKWSWWKVLNLVIPPPWQELLKKKKKN